MLCDIMPNVIMLKVLARGHHDIKTKNIYHNALEHNDI